ncbi:hypothetical protein HID58_013389 [Brassica napus]|uniref:Uncharacterized protein n=1 Tax=Brassica napus TaxID=3708 RepID=A0ABQ8E3S5_BRANA|nr:hypothetical protein HID58_013389 [Brassica napus]
MIVSGTRKDPAADLLQRLASECNQLFISIVFPCNRLRLYGLGGSVLCYGFGGGDIVPVGNHCSGRGQRSIRQDEAPIGGRPTSSGIADLVRQPAEAYEAQLLPMFEGYMIILVRPSLPLCTKGNTGVNMYGGDMFSRFSPGMRSPSHVPSFPSRQSKNGTADTRVDVQDPPQIDELDGNSSIREKSGPCETSPGDPKSDRPETLFEETVTGAMPKSSPRVDVFVAVSKVRLQPNELIYVRYCSSISYFYFHFNQYIFLTVQPSSSIPVIDGGNAVVSASAEAKTTFIQPHVPSSVISEVSFINSGIPSSYLARSTLLSSPLLAPLSDTPPSASEAVVQSQVPTDVSHTNTEPADASTVEVIPIQLHVLPSSIHQVISNNLIYSMLNGMVTITLQPSSSPTIEPMLHGGEVFILYDDVEGSVATKEDEVLTKKTTLNPTKAARAVKLATVGPHGGFKRYSKRERHSPDRYTLFEVPRKQEPIKLTRLAPKEKEKDFTPFLPLNHVKRAAFLQAMKDAKNQSATKDSAFQVDTVLPLFDCSRVVSEKAIDRVVDFIRKRRDGFSAVMALMLLELHAVGNDVNIVKFTKEHARTAVENYAIQALHLCQDCDKTLCCAQSGHNVHISCLMMTALTYASLDFVTLNTPRDFMRTFLGWPDGMWTAGERSSAVVEEPTCDPPTEKEKLRDRFIALPVGEKSRLENPCLHVGTRYAGATTASDRNPTFDAAARAWGQGIPISSYSLQEQLPKAKLTVKHSPVGSCTGNSSSLMSRIAKAVERS